MRFFTVDKTQSESFIAHHGGTVVATLEPARITFYYCCRAPEAGRLLSEKVIIKSNARRKVAGKHPGVVRVRSRLVINRHPSVEMC